MLLFASIVLAGAIDGFGRFTGDGPYMLPGFEGGAKWFRVLGDNSPPVSFAPDSARSGVELRERASVVVRIRSGPGIPIRVRYSLTGEGVEFECLQGLALRGKGSAPFITWADGSVGPGVPAPPSDWYLLSWSEERAPLLLTFPDNQAALIAAEADGEFHIATEAPIAGRVFIRAPLGEETMPTSRAADLGELLRRVRPLLSELARPLPRLVEEVVSNSGDSVSVTWKFDREGAMLPAPLSQDHGGAIVVSGQTIRRGDGALHLDGTEATVTFRVRRLLPGAAVLAGGSSSIQPPTVVSPGQPNTVFDGALAWLNGVTEPTFTRNLLKTRDDLASRDSLSTEAKAVLLFLTWGLNAQDAAQDFPTANVDWHSWRSHSANPDEDAVMACILTMSDRAEDRLAAGMIAASLSSRSLPLQQLRSQLFPKATTTEAAWFRAMTSPVRLLSTRGVSAKGEAGSFVLEGYAQAGAAINALVYCGEHLRIASASNAQDVLASRTGSVWTIVGRATDAGLWRIRIGRPNGSKALPTAAQGPSYSVSQR